MKKRKGDHFMDYADVVETACLTGPPSLAPYSGFARFDLLYFKILFTYFIIPMILYRKLINVFLCITQVFIKITQTTSLIYILNKFYFLLVWILLCLHRFCCQQSGTGIRMNLFVSINVFYHHNTFVDEPYCWSY